MHILMSIQTKYARKIFDGRKQWEFRKTLPGLARDSLFPVTVVVYSAGEDRSVIGEFEVGRVVSTSFNDLMAVTGAAGDPEAVAWLGRYYRKAPVCNALEVRMARLYERPIGLSELRQKAPSFRPPQNFFYLENNPELAEALRSFDRRSSEHLS